MKIDETDWASMTLGQRIRHFEVEGFVVLPGMLDARRDRAAEVRAGRCNDGGT